jgi:hypothetical protein
MIGWRGDFSHDRAVKTVAEGVNALKASFLEAAEAAKAIEAASRNIGVGGSPAAPEARTAEVSGIRCIK